MMSPRQWWRRAAAAAKDKRSLYLSRITGGCRHRALAGSGGFRSSALDAAVIHATSHDERSIDYKNAGRVFAWARTSPSLLDPLMWALARRAGRTRSWPVALKALMLAHGLLLCSDECPPAFCLGRLPFDLSDFRDRSSLPSQSSGFSAFVRAYFHFLDLRSRLPSHETGDHDENSNSDSDSDRDLHRLERLQALLHLLMQIRPYAGGMEVGLILEAMDCVVIEIFDVYSGICNGIACFLVGILGPSASGERGEEQEAMRRRRRGAVGMRILRRAAEQSSQLSAYFEACRSLGVLNATEFPPVERIPDEDIRDLERLVMGGISGTDEDEPEEQEAAPATSPRRSGTVVTEEWVVFDDGEGVAKGHCGNAKGEGNSGNGRWERHSGKWNPFLCSPERPSPAPSSWAATVSHHDGVPTFRNGNLIEQL
ncbi:putative clathrin assembly protein At1g25240 [Phoenix dactylifera]|uniref:Clathrin assembly protein At1g25240 n=1 Tax=Phoenix dactylifera TaxID=42345 RepID=A0A8B7CUD7_PHODC|nr:putative clathrin assembly protein At1g25240 [Phoenix dactylifera]